MSKKADTHNSAPKRSSRRGVVSFDGIQLSNGSLVYPGLSNTFENYERIPWVSRHKSIWLGGLLLTISLTFTLVNIRWGPSDEELDRIAVGVDLGDVIQPFQKKPAKPREEVDEVFGNEFIKDKKVDPNQEDPRIATAANSAVAGGNGGVDLSPGVRPLYTAAARSAGVEGTVTLEIIIDEGGKVLRAGPVGKRLGLGLDEAAASTYRAKRFSPYVVAGKAVPIKSYIRVKFALE
jgi:TonB family protein